MSLIFRSPAQIAPTRSVARWIPLLFFVSAGWLILADRTAFGQASPTSAARQGPARKMFSVVIIIGDHRGQFAEGSCLIPAPEARLGNWKWTGPDQQPDLPLLQSVNPDGSARNNSNGDEIRPKQPRQEAWYELVDSKDQFTKENPGKLTIRVHHPDRLQPGVYSGVLPFLLRMTALDSANEGTIPADDQPVELKILVVKAGRRLHQLRMLTPGETRSEIAFGKPWQIEVDIDEFSLESVNNLSPLQLEYDVSMAFDSRISVPLARFQMAAASSTSGDIRFVPPEKTPDDQSGVWDDLLVDFAALSGEESGKNSTTLPFLYNSRTQIAGLGPTTWIDPVCWKAQPTQPSVPPVGYQAAGERARWQRRTIAVGLPALDLLGQIKATVRLAGSLADAGHELGQTTEVAEGFAVFPHVAILDEPLYLIAATKAKTAETAQFQLRHLQRGEPTTDASTFKVKLIRGAGGRGTGDRWSQLAENRVDCVLTFLNDNAQHREGLWEVECLSPSTAGEDDVLPASWRLPARFSIVGDCPRPTPLVIFADAVPDVFSPPLSWVSQAEKREEGYRISMKKGGEANAETRWTITSGIISNPRVAMLQPVRVDYEDRPLSESQILRISHYQPIGLPHCRPKAIEDLYTWKDIPGAGVNYSWDLDFLTDGKADLAAIPVPIEQRNYEYRLPFLFWTKTPTLGDSVRVVVRPLELRVRYERDYRDLRLLCWGTFGAIVLLGISFLAVVWRSRQSALAGDLGTFQSLSSQPVGMLDGAPSSPSVSTPAKPPAPQPEPPTDDTPGLL